MDTVVIHVLRHNLYEFPDIYYYIVGCHRRDDVMIMPCDKLVFLP